jgi:hypothetical protein
MSSPALTILFQKEARAFQLQLLAEIDQRLADDVKETLKTRAQLIDYRVQKLFWLFFSPSKFRVCFISAASHIDFGLASLEPVLLHRLPAKSDLQLQAVPPLSGHVSSLIYWGEAPSPSLLRSSFSLFSDHHRARRGHQQLWYGAMSMLSPRADMTDCK